MIIERGGLYLNRSGKRVGITRDRGPGEVWRWVTTLGYYVMANGRAAYVGNSDKDLTVDITPSAAQVAGMDSTMGVLR